MSRWDWAFWFAVGSVLVAAPPLAWAMAVRL